MSPITRGEVLVRSCSLILCALTSVVLLVACKTIPEPPEPVQLGEMALVPAGWFLMGEEDGPESSRPQREVYLDAFMIDRIEVTNNDFREYVQETGARPKVWEDPSAVGAEMEPIAGVLWLEADAYCRWAGKRLPTEAEWEKAARGTDGRVYPWGDEWDPSRVNTMESELGRIMPVGSFPSGVSPFGVLDMAGNVQEWVSDYFDPDYYSYAPDRNPRGPDKVLDHGLRGGSWRSPQKFTMTFYRNSSHAVSVNLRVGFRCAVSVDDPGG
jgi:sulfatase modifying factor 1